MLKISCYMKYVYLHIVKCFFFLFSDKRTESQEGNGLMLLVVYTRNGIQLTRGDTDRAVHQWKQGWLPEFAIISTLNDEQFLFFNVES